MKKKILLASAIAALAYGLAVPAWAGAVLRAVVVETDDVAGYVEAIAEGKAIMKSVGMTSVVRVWQATYAGPNTGAVVVSVEWADMAAMAADDAKIAASKEYQDWLASLDDIRTIVSDSLYAER